MTEPDTAALRDWPCTNTDHLGLCGDSHVHADHLGGSAALTVGLFNSMSADELADELADRLRDGYDEDGLWDTLRRLAGRANGLTDV